MMEVDLIVEGISELVTCAGTAPRVGKDLKQTGIIEDGFVACRDGKIAAVGRSGEMAGAYTLRPGGQRVHAGGRTVLPGLVDAHTHLAFGGSREDEFNRILEGESYLDIAATGGGIIQTVEATRKAESGELEETSRAYLDRMLRHGTTTAEAKSGYGLDLETETKQLDVIRSLDEAHPIDLVPTFMGAHIVPPEFHENREAYLSLLTESMIPEIASKGLAEYCDVFCENGVYTLSESRRVLEAGLAHGLKPKIHAEEFTDLGGAGMAAELNAASADHLSFISPEGIEAMALSQTTAVLLPATTFFLRKDTYAPARKLVEAGVPVALATDFNPGSSMTISMQAVFWLACLKLGLSIDEVITASTLNAAHAIGRAHECGSIEVGKLADLAVFDITNRYHLVYQWGTNHACLVIKRGRIVFQDAFFPGRVVTSDPV